MWKQKLISSLRGTPRANGLDARTGCARSSSMPALRSRASSSRALIAGIVPRLIRPSAATAR